MNIKLAKQIVAALPSLYPLKDYEVEAIHVLLIGNNEGSEVKSEEK